VTVARNYVVTGLTARNTVVIRVDGRLADTDEPPSTYLMAHLPSREQAILRRGLSRAGVDRLRPVGATLEAEPFAAT
jgi:hypothetical protein